MSRIIICKECGKSKEHKAKGKCKSCYDKIRQKEYYVKNKKLIKSKNKEYYEKN